MHVTLNPDSCQSTSVKLRKTYQSMSPEEAVEYLLNNDPRFEVTPAEIRGVHYNRVFSNAPPHLRALLQKSSEVYEDGEILVYQDERWTYEEFCNDVKRLAYALKNELNVKKGDHVAIAMRNYPEFTTLFMAIASIGAVAVLMNAWWTEEELAYAVEDSGADLIFADGPRYKRLQPIVENAQLKLVAVREAEGHLTYQHLLNTVPEADWPEDPIDTDDDFSIIYSSGSTGQPKGVVLTHRGVISSVHSWIMGAVGAPLLDDAEPPSEQPHSWLIITPLFHVTALHSNFLHGIASGAKMHLMYKWDAEEAIRIIKDEKVTRFVGVPTQSAELMETAKNLNEKLETLEVIGAGGAKSPASQVLNLAETFSNAKINAGWGMTETNSIGIIVAGPVFVDNPESIGTLTPPLQEALIVDENYNPLPTGEVGELIIKSPSNMRCYLNKPEATAEALEDGWLRTGDLARIDEDGLFYIVDRKKNIIIRGGENISCLDVEGALHRHPDVFEACVFPVPHEKLGEIVGAAIFLRQNANITARELATFLVDHIALYKVPEQYWFWTEPLPRVATLKVDRRGIREKCLTLEPQSPLTEKNS